MIDLGLSGKRAVVSGAGYIPERAGHGWFTSLALAEAGASVACIDIDEQRAEHIVGEIAGRGGNAVPIVADMTDPVQVGRAIDDAVAALGGVDVCVDIIGGATWSKVEDFTTQLWDAAIHYNLTQVFYLFQAAARYMIAQRSGGSLSRSPRSTALRRRPTMPPTAPPRPASSRSSRPSRTNWGITAFALTRSRQAMWAPATRTSPQTNTPPMESTRWRRPARMTSPTPRYSSPLSWLPASPVRPSSSTAVPPFASYGDCPNHRSRPTRTTRCRTS